jgi:hypothetical protein
MDGPPASRLHRSGPWLVVYGSGPDSEDAALQVQKQCIDHEVDILLCPIDEVRQARLDHFTGLVLALPSQPVSSSAALGSFVRLVTDYRARRPEGLVSVLNGSSEWFDAGVVQVISSRGIMKDPTMRPVLNRVCVWHHTDDSEQLDVFQPYTRSLVCAEQPSEEPAYDVRDDSIERLWRDIQTWGVRDIQDVPKLRKCIDNFRNHYEDQRFSQLYRPIPGFARNRLDIILDGPHDAIIGDRKTWMENGARVCRDVLKEIKTIVPGLARAAGRDNTKDAQKQLRRFYRNVRILDEHMRSGEYISHLDE